MHGPTVDFIGDAYAGDRWSLLTQLLVPLLEVLIRYLAHDVKHLSMKLSVTLEWPRCICVLRCEYHQTSHIEAPGSVELF